jgi:hypothetical protein
MPELSPTARTSGDPLVVVRYLDVVLVVLAAPFVVLTGLPIIGYVAGTLAWMVNRALGMTVERAARHKQDVRAALGLNLGGLLARAWLVALAILVVGLAGERQDGLMAAVLLLCAFTLYFATSLVLRPLERKNPQP